ncbi:tryptophan aminotransferase-related protein 2-like [Cucurbita pepo subsp. pepo]|uniref:tryptophan aminotransferase-related protein 2-like n=1 Tax=Cucurbita pepo subsp. pepo TaxID=3664 RepID=UPI000C9D6B3A|nr:tryptophan aminotransferase-related protein 2-like [Cucurbita pepo subsp. pepo]
MARIADVVSFRHLFVLSLALNVSLILRGVNQNEKHQSGAPMAVHKGTKASQMRFLSFPSESAAAAAAAHETQPSVDEHGGQRVINLDHGDPTMYEQYWKAMGDKTTIVIPGWQSMSYFSAGKNLCWFLEPELSTQIVRVHKVAGNAVTEGRHIVVGTGSSQLFLAALYALSPQDSSNPISVVSTAPYYSSYPLMTDCVKSGLHKWAGDAKQFDKDEPYIELVTSPNNPDGFIRHSVVNRTGGILIHDLAYYWPQYTPISAPSDYDLTMFTVSKSTGHAGTRIGWALVKDVEVAKRMVKFIELSTIGVSKDSQLRAAKVLEVVSDSSEQAGGSEYPESFFHFSHAVMTERWRLLREAVKDSGLFSLPKFSPAHCSFFDNNLGTQPAFAWLRCDGADVDDCESFFRGHKILARGGKHFGVSPKYVRVSMLDREETYSLFIERLSQISS